MHLAAFGPGFEPSPVLRASLQIWRTIWTAKTTASSKPASLHTAKQDVDFLRECLQLSYSDQAEQILLLLVSDPVCSWVCSNPACGGLCSKCFRDRQQTDLTQHASEKAAAKGFDAPALAQAITQVSQPETLPAPVAIATPPAPAQPQAPETVSIETEQTASAGPPSTSQTAEEQDPNDHQRPVQKNTNRCFSCNKRVGLTGFKCRCDYVFCGTHRLPEEHHCDFDYKTTGREQLSKNNPLVVPSKLNRV